MAGVRVVALYDIHANLPALRAVLPEAIAAEPDVVVIGGDVLPGPQPAETLAALLALDMPLRWVRGNGDRETVDAFDGRDIREGPVADGTRWTARQLSREHRDLLAGFEETVTLDDVLFCHGSPRSDEEIITRVTPEGRLRDVLDGVDARLVVCGHTHQQFDRRVGARRVVNAGSVGMPYEGEAAAFWLLLDGEVHLRRTAYDIEAAAAEMRATGFPDIDEMMLRESLLEPTDSGEVARYFEDLATR
jgi:putative phosphoesterase